MSKPVWVEVDQFGDERRFYENGGSSCWRGDVLHCEDGPAMINAERREWYRNGQLHRDDGPAVEYASSPRREWYRNGQLHRLDGPAVDDPLEPEWWVLGRRVAGP